MFASVEIDGRTKLFFSFTKTFNCKGSTFLLSRSPQWQNWKKILPSINSHMEDPSLTFATIQSCSLWVCQMTKLNWMIKIDYCQMYKQYTGSLPRFQLFQSRLTKWLIVDPQSTTNHFVSLLWKSWKRGREPIHCLYTQQLRYLGFEKPISER